MTLNAIGLMSGTSLDGLDLCHATFSQNEDARWNFVIKHVQTIPYPEMWVNRLKNAINASATEIFELHTDFGFYLGEQTQKFIAKNQIQNVEVIASHGHTIFHQPEKRFTVQIGDGRAIKLINQIPVVYDFRSQDVLLGGHGAPLVPIGDELLFSAHQACINLGGFSNISMNVAGKRVAFDICPVNIVLNALARKLGKEYDEGGELARNASVDFDLLKKLNENPFYNQKPPKSLGLEWVLKEIFPLLENINSEVALATFTEHIATQIANIFNEYELDNVLFSGGGTYNQFLIERIKDKTNTEIHIPSKEIIEYKEALIFGFMGVLRLLGKNNVLSSATGSTYDHCSGLLV